MATTVTTKQHDTKILFKDTPTIDGVVVPAGDLAGCTLSFLLKSPTLSLKQAAVINPDGTFQYQPVTADVSQTGTYQQEWEVVYADGKILTFPNGDYNSVIIIADLG